MLQNLNLSPMRAKTGCALPALFHTRPLSRILAARQPLLTFVPFVQPLPLPPRCSSVVDPKKAWHIVPPIQRSRCAPYQQAGRFFPARFSVTVSLKYLSIEYCLLKHASFHKRSSLMIISQNNANRLCFQSCALIFAQWLEARGLLGAGGDVQAVLEALIGSQSWSAPKTNIES